MYVVYIFFITLFYTLVILRLRENTMKKIILLIIVISNVGLFANEINLNQDENDGITLMREEEKLARDVYIKLYEVWNLNIFNNISKSEQTHMDRVKTLFSLTNLTDPVEIDIPGVFQNKELQELYLELVNKGSNSILDAIKIGLTIEDLDIYDLEHLISQTENKEIILVYENLRDASINHLNSFNRQLIKYGGNYTPQYISDEYYHEILR